MIRRPLPLSRPGRQQGVVLFVAMVVLVALAIAALALLRSTDVASLLSGNLSFKRSALNSTEIGYQKAVENFTSINANNPTLTQDALCYSASQVDVDGTSGVPTLMSNTSTFDTKFTTCSIAGAGGETVRFYIDRLCSTAGTAPADTFCTVPEKVITMVAANHGVLPLSKAAYRVTVRVDGPSGTISYAQYIAKNT